MDYWNRDNILALVLFSNGLEIPAVPVNWNLVGDYSPHDNNFHRDQLIKYSRGLYLLCDNEEVESGRKQQYKMFAWT